MTTSEGVHIAATIVFFSDFVFKIRLIILGLFFQKQNNFKKNFL